MAETYRVLTHGLKPGFPRARAEALLTVLFKRTKEELRPIFEVDGTVIKSAVDLSTALRYKDALEQRGCLCSFALETVASFSHADGMNAHELGKNRLAFKMWSLLAEQGDAKSQNSLAYLYAAGKGVAQDGAQAFVWYLKSAEQGLAKAQYSVGHAYYRGDGVARDLAQALDWFGKAAGQRVPWAQFQLGYMYEMGEGVAIDHRQAARWYALAAEQGNPTAQFNLAKLYCQEGGVGRDYAEAYKWMSISRANGGEDTVSFLQRLEGLLSGEELAGARQRASAWLRTHHGVAARGANAVKPAEGGPPPALAPSPAYGALLRPAAGLTHPALPGANRADSHARR